MIERRDDFHLLLKQDGIGIELGVARGLYSEQLLRTTSLSLLISVDSWSRLGHNDQEALNAIERLRRFGSRSVVLWMEFEIACVLFPDAFFDFIYIDGIAQLGPMRELRQWFPKLKAGGIFAGHDFHPRWPRTIRAVKAFCDREGYDGHLNFTRKDRYPSWWLRK